MTNRARRKQRENRRVPGPVAVHYPFGRAGAATENDVRLFIGANRAVTFGGEHAAYPPNRATLNEKYPETPFARETNDDSGDGRYAWAVTRTPRD